MSGILGVVAGRRESESEREDGAAARKRDLQAVPEAEEGREGKRRRIAPTPVTIGSSLNEADSAIASTEENTPTTQTPTH